MKAGESTRKNNARAVRFNCLVRFAQRLASNGIDCSR